MTRRHVLFIGGPRDGKRERVKVPDDYRTAYPILSNPRSWSLDDTHTPDITEHVYRLETLSAHDDPETKVDTMISQDLTCGQALVALVNGYWPDAGKA